MLQEKIPALSTDEAGESVTNPSPDTPVYEATGVCPHIGQYERSDADDKGVSGSCPSRRKHIITFESTLIEQGHDFGRFGASETDEATVAGQGNEIGRASCRERV